MSSRRSHDEVERWERDLLERVPFAAEHVPDAETYHYDARLVESYFPTSTIGVGGEICVPRNAIVELKTCQKWINDRGSHGGRRRGAFQIRDETHNELVELDGWYSFLVLDGDEILAGWFWSAGDVSGKLSFTNGGSGSEQRRAHLSWPYVVPRARV